MYDDLEGDILLLNPRDDVHNSGYVFDEDVCVKNMLMSFQIPCCRDKGKHTYGDKLLSLCKSNNFFNC